MVESVGERLERSRKEVGLSREQVAERLGVSVSTIQAHENGRNQLKPDGLISYSRIYNVSIDWLVTGKRAQTAEIVDIWSRIPDRAERDAWLNMGKAIARKADEN